jgi:multiple sugar transport system permease protein
MASNRNSSKVAYLFVLPYFVLFICFFLIPAITILPMSLTSWNIVGNPKWIGLNNYIRIFGDPYFIKAIFNTFYYTIMVTILLVGLGLFLALLLNQPLRGRVVGRVFVIMPYVISSAVAGVVWKWMYSQNFGIFNSYLRGMGLQPMGFLTDPSQAMPSLIFMNGWWSVGFNTIIYLAALQGIPEDLYQAATVDGANSWQLFRYITWPLLRPITLYVTVLCLANSFQMFDESYMMTQGGPIGSTVTLVYKAYTTAFENFRFGEAAAISVITVLFILIFTVIQFGFARRGAFEQ